MNLDPAIPLLSPCFSSIGRLVEYDPLCILRSLVLMLDHGYHSVTKWVEVLRSDDIWAVLCGFEPHNTPGVGKFYDFFDRLYLEDRKVRIERKFKLRSFTKKPTKKLKAGEKLPLKPQGF